MLQKILLIATLLMGTVNAASLNGEVNQRSMDVIISQLMLDDAITPEGEPLMLTLNSGGGGVLAGFKLINRMRSI